MGATIKDVARLAGVSTATISRVINNDPRIAPTTRERVVECIRSSGYRINKIARSLKINKTHTIGFVAPELANDFFMTIAKGVEETVAAAGYSLLIASSNENAAQEALRIDLLIEKCVDGVIIIPATSNGRHFIELREGGIPVVLADRLVSDFPADAVLVDNVQGSREAVALVIEEGCERIGFIGGDLDLTSAQERFKGYLKALADHGVRPEQAIIKFGDFHIDSGYALMRELMEEPNPPEHVFISNYYMHIGATMYLVDHASTLPRVPAIAGFDDMEFTSLLGFASVTVKQPVIEIGRRAAELLIRKIEAKDKNPNQPARPRFQILRLPGELLVRDRPQKTILARSDFHLQK